MSIVSLVIAPTLAKIHHDKISANRNAQLETLIKMSNKDKSDEISNP
jgi:K(+)-stimulated pyrophosphate-energized sodium pump